MAKPTDQTDYLTSFHDVTLKARLRDLITLFPESYKNYGNLGEGKVNFSFTLETDEGVVFTIYDWKEYRPITLDEEIEWNIGGHGFSSDYDGKLEVEAMIASLRQLEAAA